MMIDLFKRKLKLVNFRGQELDLLGHSSVYQDKTATPFFSEPEGLGFKIDIETISALNELIVTNAEYNFPDIKGNLVFQSYTKYDEFIRYITKSQILNKITYGNKNTLKLYYETTEEYSDRYYHVIITEVQKGEKDENGLLICGVTFKRLSHLKEDVLLTQENGVDVSGLVTFPLNTQGSSFIKFNKTGKKSYFNFLIRNTSNLEIPVKLTIDGGYSNPSWHNYTNGLRGQYFLTSGDGTIIVDANTPQEVTENGINKIDKINHELYYNFLLLAPGYNVIKVETEEGGEATSYCKVTLQYSRDVIG